MSNVTTTTDNEIVLRADIEDILILTSAGLTLVKAIFSVGTYSSWCVVFALLEFICTSITLALFIMNDYAGEDKSSVYEGEYYDFGFTKKTIMFGNDNLLFLLRLCSSCIVEVADVITTFHTVRAHKEMKREVYSRRMTPRDFRGIKRSAKYYYVLALVVGAVLVGICPIIAFWKAGWIVDFFAPFGFSSENGYILLAGTILCILCQGLGVGVLITECGDSSLVGLAIESLYGISICLGWLVLFRVEDGPEAGSLAFFLMIDAFQIVEGVAEGRRLLALLKRGKRQKIPCLPCTDDYDGNEPENNEGDNGGNGEIELTNCTNNVSDGGDDDTQNDSDHHNDDENGNDDVEQANGNDNVSDGGDDEDYGDEAVD